MHRPQIRQFASTLLVVSCVLLVAGCNNASTAPNLQAEATVAALSTTNAQLATQVARLSAGAGLRTPTPQANAQPATEAPSATTLDAVPSQPTTPVVPAVAAPAVIQTPGDGPLPFLVANIPLAPAEKALFDLHVDRASNHIFVTDNANQLHVLDATTYAPLKTLPFGGWLELDAAHNRLYVYMPYVVSDQKRVIHVIDTATLEEVGQLEGSAIAVDAANNQLFVGDPYTYSTKPDAPGVRIIDGATLQQTGAFTQTGVPVYNPQSQELLIVAYTVYAADPKRQQVTADLFPELTDVGAGGFLWCNGCIWVDNVQFHPGPNLIEVDAAAHCAGKGCGKVTPPVFFDATTMARIDAAVAPERQTNCGSQATTVGAVNGRRYHNAMYDRYLAYTNLQVADEQGAPVTVRDGLRTDFINPNTNQGYLYDGTVLDMTALAPIGAWKAACLFTYEHDKGLLYGRRGGSLYVIAERGAQPAAPAKPERADLPKTMIDQIALSPAFATDNTLLAISGDAFYRSTDGGATWMRLHGGLGDNQQGVWNVAFSPNYAADHTIFAGGYRGDYRGDGVWHSQDGGDTWSALWNNLQHRRITSLYFAPDFAATNTMVAKAKFYDVNNGIAGESYQQSSDGGLSWTLVVTGNYSTAAGEVPLPPVSELLPGYAAGPALNARLGPYFGDPVQYKPDGSTWQTATMALDKSDTIYALIPAPTYPTEPTIFAFANRSLWRSTDDGATWAAWDDPRLAGLDYTNYMASGVVSPALTGGGYRLFVGTADGQVWVLDPAQMQWKPAVTPQAATVAAASTVTATVASALPTTAPVTATQAAATGSTAEAPAAAGLPTPTPGGAAATPVTEAAALTGEPPQGLFRPEGPFAIIWEKTPHIQQDLGWAKQAGPGTTSAAYQRFDNGVMVWRQDTGQIYAFFNDGTWQSFADTFKEGDPEKDPKFAPPPGKMQPIRGFGKVGRSTPAREKSWAGLRPKSRATMPRSSPMSTAPCCAWAGLSTQLSGWTPTLGSGTRKVAGERVKAERVPQQRSQATRV